MDVIYFTHGATDLLRSFDATGARFLPLADGTGGAHISCLHLEEGSTICAPSITHAATLLVVHGRITITRHSPSNKMHIHAGMGAVFNHGERYSIESATGAIVLIVEAGTLQAHERAVSTPSRIAGQAWPNGHHRDS